MHFQTDSAMPAASPIAAARGRVSLAGVVRLAALGTLIALGACGNRQRVPSYNLPTNPPPARDMSTATRLRVAEAAESSGNWDMAASLYLAAATAEPNRADIQARLASALQRGGNVPRAEEVLTRALERHPNDPALNMQLGRLRLRTGAAEQALNVFDRVLQRQPNNADALDGRGVALDLLERPAEAQQAYLAARAISPNDPRIASNLAFSLLLEGRAREARDILEPFAGRTDLPSRARTSLAIARAMTGDRDGAMSLLGTGVTREDLDQLVAGLPNSRPAGAARGGTAGQGGAAPAASGPEFRPFGEEPRPPRPARQRTRST